MSHSQVAWSPEPGENRRGAQLDLGAADPRRRSGVRLAKRYHSFPGPPPSPGDERGASTAPAEFNTSWGSKGPATRKRQEILATLGPSSSPGPLRVPWGWPGCASTVGAAPQAPSCGPRPGEAPGLETRRGRPHPARPAAAALGDRPHCPAVPDSAPRVPKPAVPSYLRPGLRCPRRALRGQLGPSGALRTRGRSRLGPRCAPQLLGASAPRFSPAISLLAQSLGGGRRDSGKRGAGSAGGGARGGRGGGRAGGGGAGAPEPAQTGEGAAATPRQPRAPFPRLLRRPFTPLPSFHSCLPSSSLPFPASSSSLSISPPSPLFSPFLLSPLFPAPSASPAPLSPSLSPSFAFRLVASSRPWPVCLGLCVPVLFNMDFPLGFSLSSLADLLLMVFFVSLSLFHPLLSL